MQAAARKVLEENKRLRALLKNRGMSDAEIGSFMAAEGNELLDETGVPPSQKLTKMLLTRTPCCPDNEGGCSPPSAGRVSSPPDTKPQLQLPLPPQHAQHQQLNSRQLAPLPIQSSTSQRTALPIATTIPISSAPLQMAPSYHSTLGPHHTGPSSHNTPAYSYSSQYEPHWQPQPPPVSAASYDSAGHGRPMQSYPQDIRSCGDPAVTIIRGMRVDQGQDHDTDLGYAPVSDHRVDNITAMDDIQKYGPQSQGMWR
jgi:hypothetical protein